MTPEQMESMLDRLWALYSAEQMDNHYIRPLDRNAFTAIVKPPLEKFAPDFSAKGRNAEHGIPQAKYAVAAFIYAVGESIAALPYSVGNSNGTSCPMSWQRPFREAFDRGEIDDVALGAAVHLIYRHHGPRRGSRGEMIPETLANLRVSNPSGLMNGPAFAMWRSLPDRVTIYRGALTHSVEEAARGISWSFSRGYAAAHLYRRILPFHEGTEIRTLMGQSPPRPQLISVVAPKSAIIATIGSADHEVFVDYEKLAAASIKSLPANNLLHQAVVEKFANIGKLAVLARR